eukprot:2550958-Ditylum_brightwellii.AAC.1
MSAISPLPWPGLRTATTATSGCSTSSGGSCLRQCSRLVRSMLWHGKPIARRTPATRMLTR